MDPFLLHAVIALAFLTSLSAPFVVLAPSPGLGVRVAFIGLVLVSEFCLCLSVLASA